MGLCQQTPSVLNLIVFQDHQPCESAMRTISLMLCLLGVGICTMCQAQGPMQGPGMGIVPPPGKLYVRMQGDAGTKFSYLVGPNSWKTNAVPCDLTLQPGVRYLFKVENLTNCPGQVFYPSLEVLDVLYLPPKLKASDHPAPIMLTEQDGLAVLRGAMITKVVTLEDPEGTFVGINGNVNGGDAEPLGGLDALTFAKEVGRPVAILRWGNKEPTREELEGKMMNANLGGSMPGCGPIVPIKPFKIGEECLRDGGDFNKPAYFDHQGKLQGLEPSDTVLTYRDRTGKKIILPSNPVCLCVPRFVNLRQVTQLEAFELDQGAGKLGNAELGLLMAKKDKAVPAKQLEDGVVLKTAVKAMVDIGRDKVVALTSLEGVRIIGRMDKALETVGTEVPPPDCTDEPLEVCKSCSTDKAQIGDIVTYTIKYANKSCQPILDVALSDSLTARLEYIPGTAKSTREAIFVTTKNEAGSLVLRWELKDSVPAKQGGEVTFQARVR